MNIFQRITARLLFVLLVINILPFQVLAFDPEVSTFETTYINPLYADVISEEDLLSPSDQPMQIYDNPSYAKNVEEAGAFLKEAMLERLESITVYVFDYEATQESFEALCLDIANAAVTHTGIPTEGDYLKWQYGGYNAECSCYSTDGGYNFDITFTITYYTTIEQEAEVDTAVGNLLNELDVSSVSDYEKVKAVYDYICANVTYDHDNLNDDSYKLKHTAYAALIDGTAVCQGYALLLYRLALELGVDCRLIAGSTSNGDHGWNIVELDSFYYNADSTWDAGETEYDYFLKCQDNFPDHNRFEEYATSEFYAAYPMSETDYVVETEPEIIGGTCGDNLTWSFDEETGTLTISGTGDMTDFSDAGEAPWCLYDENILNYETDILSVVVESGITSIGDYSLAGLKKMVSISLPEGIVSVGRDAFGNCYSLSEITFPATLESMGAQVFVANPESIVKFLGGAPNFDETTFAGVTATVYYPATNTTWTKDVMLNYGGTITWKPYCPDNHTWDGGVTTKEPTETEPGIRTYTCTTCGETKTEEIPVHVHEYAAVITEPTCTEQGYTTYTCGCGESYVDDYVEATGHSYGDWYQIKAPTEEEVGEEQRDCANCDHSETREIDKLSPSEDPSGTCGENVTWDFEEDTGTLTISGNETAEVASARSSTNCAMDDYASAEDTPWYPYQDQITTVIIKSTVDSVGSNAFSGCSNLTTVIIEEGFSQIDDTAFADCPALETCYYEGSAEQWEELNADIGTAVVHYDSAEPEVHTETKTTVDPTCTEQGYDLYTCSCGTERRANFVDATGHSWNEGEVTKEPTPEESGIKTFTCEICGETSTEEIPYETPETSSVQRVYGESRADTALEVAKATKEALGVEKFDTIIIANGEDKNFADALTGSYLANVKSAPILMYRTSGLSESTMEYIQNNLSENGTIYLLGGESAIPASVEESLAAYTIKRLAGTSRMDTNLEILKEAGVGSEEILIARGYEFADSLSASATGKPILLVNEVTGKLTEAQITFLSGLNGNKLTILGGTLAISEELEAAIEEVVGTDVDRVYGTSREDTSVAIAKRYFEAPSFAVVAYSRKSPDGLCGGPLAYAMDAPLLLTNAGKEESANTYITETEIEAGYVLGGTLVITDETARAVFGLPENAVIAKK